MNLQELQTNFQHIILDSECSDANWVSKSEQGLSSQERLAIYHNAYRVRLIDVLMDTFEHTAAYLGDDWFQDLASIYVQSHNSTHNNIGAYGKEFPQFLAAQLPADKEVSELALLDWKLRRAFDGADSSIMTHEHLQQLASTEQEISNLQPVPTLNISKYYFNTLDIWHAINLEQQPPVVQQLPQPVDVVIWRKEHSPHFRSISKMESQAITYVCSGYTLNAIGAELEKDFPEVDVAKEFGHMLHHWINDQLLSFN
jgi:hypothetical protein